MHSSQGCSPNFCRTSRQIRYTSNIAGNSEKNAGIEAHPKDLIHADLEFSLEDGRWLITSALVVEFYLGGCCVASLIPASGFGMSGPQRSEALKLTLPETKELHLNIGGWKTMISYWDGFLKLAVRKFPAALDIQEGMMGSDQKLSQACASNECESGH